MNEQNDKFNYSYSAPTEDERREIDGIRRAYLPEKKQISKLDRLRALDKKVNNAATISSLSLGMVGLLLFGLGMAMMLSWKIWIGGAVVSFFGIIPMALAYPVYKRVLKQQKTKHREEILRLSEELLHEE